MKMKLDWIIKLTESFVIVNIFSKKTREKSIKKNM